MPFAMRLSSRDVAPGYVGIEAGISDEIAGLEPGFSPSRRVLAAALRPASRFASLAGLRHGFAPIRNAQLGHAVAVQRLTSASWPPQQSIQRSRRAWRGDIRRCASASRSVLFIFLGSRPMGRASGPSSRPGLSGISGLHTIVMATCQREDFLSLAVYPKPGELEALGVDPLDILQ
jgi:hypothetical protein